MRNSMQWKLRESWTLKLLPIVCSPVALLSQHLLWIYECKFLIVRGSEVTLYRYSIQIAQPFWPINAVLLQAWLQAGWTVRCVIVKVKKWIITESFITEPLLLRTLLFSVSLLFKMKKQKLLARALPPFFNYRSERLKQPKRGVESLEIDFRCKIMTLFILSLTILRWRMRMDVKVNISGFFFSGGLRCHDATFHYWSTRFTHHCLTWWIANVISDVSSM